MSSSPQRHIRVAVVQAPAVEAETSLARQLAVLSKLIDAAAVAAERVKAPIQVCVLPELFREPYDIAHLADYAPSSRASEVFLQRTAKQHGWWVSGTCLEVVGPDVYNTAVVVDAQGVVRARVRKMTPSSFEAFVTQGGGATRHIVQAPELGITLGVGICYETMLRDLLPLLLSDDGAFEVDLMLLSFSAPTPGTWWGFPAAQQARFRDIIAQAGTRLCAALGVPCALANKVGPWDSSLPLPLPNPPGWFNGYSTLCAPAKGGGVEVYAQAVAEDPSGEGGGSITGTSFQVVRADDGLSCVLISSLPVGGRAARFRKSGAALLEQHGQTKRYLSSDMNKWFMTSSIFPTTEALGRMWYAGSRIDGRGLALAAGAGAVALIGLAALTRLRSR